MFTAMAHRPLVWLLIALASLGAGVAAYGPLRHALQPATETAGRSPDAERATTPESGPAAPPAIAQPEAPKVAAVRPEPVAPAAPAGSPGQGAPAPAAPAVPEEAASQPATSPPAPGPSPSAPPAERATATLETPPAPSAPAPVPAAPRPAATGVPEKTRLGELAPAAGPPTSPAPALPPAPPEPPERPGAALSPEAATVAPQVAAPAVVEPSGQPPAAAPAAGSEGQPPVVALERPPSEAGPEAREPPAGAVEHPTAAPEIGSKIAPEVGSKVAPEVASKVAPEVAKATPLPSTAPAAPESSAGAAAPPPPSLSLDTIRRALAALLGGPSEPADVAGRKVEKPEPKPAAVKPDGAKDLASAARPSAGGPDVVRPSFDIVRVEPGGRAVVAGRAAPGAEVELLAGDRVLDRVRANRRGEWVATPAEPFAPGGLELSLRAIKEGEPAVAAEQVVVVVVPEPPPPQPPPVALAEGPPPQPPRVAGAEGPPPQPPEIRLADAPSGPLAVLLSQSGRAPGRILQAPGRISSDGQLALLVLDYDDSGRTRLTGEAPPGAPLRIYVDNEPAAEAVAEPSGRWTAVLGHDLAPGDYTLRLDQLGKQGRPVARLETPFTRVSQPPIQGKTQVDYVIVQPGNSLWRISRRLFGSGMRYVQVYDANKAQIRDPDLIYPGQVFQVPPDMGSAG